MNARSQCHLLCVTLGAATLVRAPDALAWGYDEHRKIGCHAVSTTCRLLEHNDQLTIEGTRDPRVAERRRIAQELLCSGECRGAKLQTSASQPSTSHLFPACSKRDFGDGTALIDYEHTGVKLMAYDCARLDHIQHSIVTEGIQSLWADEQFCPGLPEAYDEDHARAVEKAEKAAGDPPNPEQFRRAIFDEIEALHELSDGFAAGHLFARLDDGHDHYDTKLAHDRANAEGGDVANWNHESWRCYGDGRFEDAVNVANKERVQEAAFLSLRDVVLTFVRGEAQDDTDATGSLLPKCPEGTSRHNMWGPRVDLQLVFLDFASATHHRPTVMPAISMGAFRSLGPTTALTGSLEGSIWLADASTSPLYGADSFAFRSIIFKPGIEYSPVLRRYIRYVAGADLRASLGDLVASSGKGTVGSWFDGFDARIGVELFVLRAALRTGVFCGTRRSALRDEYAFALGPFLSFGARF